MNRGDDAVATVERLVRAVPTPAGYATAVRLSRCIGERSGPRSCAPRLASGSPVSRALRLVPLGVFDCA